MDAEGITINYTTGSATVKATKSAPVKKKSTAPTTSGGWTKAATGYVFVSKTHKYYTQVKTPSHYKYMPLKAAKAAGDKPGKSNGSAKN